MAILDIAERYRAQMNNDYDALVGKMNALRGLNGAIGTAAGPAGEAAGTVNAGPAADAAGTAAAGVQPGTVRATAGLATDDGGKGTLKIPDGPSLVTPEQLNKDNYHWNQDLLNYLETPLTEEQRARRTRAAHAVAGVGALGNMLNAFSNLAFAGNAAPSQTLPKAPDAGAAVAKERERWDKVAKDYANARMQGRQMDLREWQMAQQAENERVKGLNEAEKTRYQANVQRYGLEYQQARDAIKDEQDKKRFDLEVEKFGFQKENARADRALRARSIAIQEAANRREQEKHNDIMKNGGDYNYRSAGRGYNSGAGKAAVGELMNSPSSSYRVNAKLSVNEVHNLYNGLPDDVKAGVEAQYPTFNIMTPKEREDVERSAIASQIAQSDEYAQFLQRRGYLSPNQASGDYGDDNTPPSRRAASGEDNTPPSRRK